MLKKVKPIIDKIWSPKWRSVVLAVGILAVAALVVLFWPPQRSTAAYCKVWNDGQKKLKGKDAISDAADYASFMTRLERVAPNDVRNDVHVEKLVFKKIAKDPTQAMSAGLSGLSAGSRMDSYSKSHCQ